MLGWDGGDIRVVVEMYRSLTPTLMSRAAIHVSVHAFTSSINAHVAHVSLVRTAAATSTVLATSSIVAVLFLVIVSVDALVTSATAAVLTSAVLLVKRSS